MINESHLLHCTQDMEFSIDDSTPALSQSTPKRFEQKIDISIKIS
jgi:hypothetical protein